jgi:hypothetical protein
MAACVACTLADFMDENIETQLAMRHAARVLFAQVEDCKHFLNNLSKQTDGEDYDDET